MRISTTIYAFLAVFLLSAGIVNAQSNKNWTFLPEKNAIERAQSMQGVLPADYKLVSLVNLSEWYSELDKVGAASVLVSLPNPEGNFSEFYISATSVVSEEVAHLYTIRTFKGYARNAEHVTVRCDISPTGFHAVVFNGQAAYAIEPASKNDVTVHIVYYKSDLGATGFRCQFDDGHRKGAPEFDASGDVKTPANLRTYRFAPIADATYRTQYGGAPYTVTNVLNSFASGVNLMNAVYERDLGVHLTLVSNAACANAVLADHTDIDAVHNFLVNTSGLGLNGFDVGHSLLWANTGGVAYLGVVCDASLKGGGFSGADGTFTQLYVDYAAHEVGHQFGGDHTFVATECTYSQNNYRFEPGEGSTIMAYAGVCGSGYQSFSDPYFHAASIAEINTYISSGGGCAAISTPGTGNNAAPVVNAQSDITIPKQTPFILVGSGTDANSDPVTFNWQQYNGSGTAVTGSPNCNSTTHPMFRFRVPVSENYRVFPQMSDVLAGANNTPAWEKLPCAARTMNFRVVARDNNTNWGRTSSDDVVVTVANTGPFDVTSPNGGESWVMGSSHAVTWTVNGTSTHCANVDVLISTDNGVTYTVLGTFPNNGSANVTIPNTASTTARVLVQCSVGGNFRSASTFFDVSNTVFSITDPDCGNAYWNMTAAAVTTNSVPNASFSDIGRGNNNNTPATPAIITTTSASSGYTGSSGGGNAGAAAFIGALNTATSTYFEVTVTPGAGNIFTFTGISFGSRSTSTGPQAYSVRTSADNYATTVATGTMLNNSTWALFSNTGLSTASGVGQSLTIRIYGHSGAGSATAGTANWRIDDLTISGCNEAAVTCPVLTSAPGEVQITNSTCASACTVSGGSIAAPAVGCPTGSSIQYSTDNGATWSGTLPAYNTTGPAQTIRTRCSCDTNPATTSPASTGVTTVPGTCTVPAAPTGTLAITNSTCSSCAVSGGSIAIGSVAGTGGTLQYSTDGGTTWSASLPTYNQTGPAQTILASVLGANGCRSTTTQVGQTTPGTCTVPAAPAGTLTIVNSTCSGCVASGGSIAIGTVSGTGGTLQYSTDGGTTWSATLPTYNQTGPAQTIIASVLGANGCRSTTTQVGQTTPATCPGPAAPTGTLAVTNSTCNSCVVNGGSIAIGTVTGTGGTLEYSTDGGSTWSATLPTYNQTGPAQTILASVLAAGGCRSNTTQVGQTTPGTCTTPAAPTGTLAITNSTCNSCVVNGGSIAVGSVTGTGGTLQYSTDGGTTWSATLPTYNQTGPAQTIIASVLGANGCRSTTTQVGQTTPGACTTPAAPTGTLAITNSTCNSCLVNGGSIAVGSVTGTGGTLQYSTDGGTTWSATLPTYNQTGPAQTIIASVLGANGCRSTTTQVGQTTPGTCTTPAAPTGTLAITNSTCNSCAVNGGSIAIGSVTGTGGTLQYSTDGGTTWSAALPTYNQTGPAQTILASVLGANGCRSTTTQVGQTTPGTCTTPAAPTGTLAITNSTCNSCVVNGGSIAIGSVTGTGGTLQYSTDGGTTWSATLPTYNQTGPAQTILASVLGANGCRSTTTQVGQTTPGTCTTPAAPTGTLAITNSTCSGCVASGGSIAIGTVSGTGGTLQYSTNGGSTWSATLPAYNQNGPAQTIIASVLGANGCRSTTTQVGQTTPGVCSQILNISCINTTIVFNGESSITLVPANLVSITNGCPVQSITANPATISCTSVGQVVPVVITVTDLNGTTYNCTSNVTVNGLPCGWDQNPNGVGCTNGSSISYNPATQVFTATSTNCYYANPYMADELAFAQYELCGNGSITVQVTSITGLGWAGITLRESNAPGAKKVQLATNTNSNQSRREVRYVTGGDAYPQQFPAQNRFWLRLVRQGSQFIGYHSQNGTQWYQVMAVTVSMNSCIEAGLVLTNFLQNGTVVANFAHVSITGNNNLSALPQGLVPVASEPVDFTLFPNPTSGELTVDLSNYESREVRLSVYNAQGRLLQTLKLQGDQLTKRMDLSTLPKGIYMVRAASEGLPDVTKRVMVH